MLNSWRQRYRWKTLSTRRGFG